MFGVLLYDDRCIDMRGYWCILLYMLVTGRDGTGSGYIRSVCVCKRGMQGISERAKKNRTEATNVCEGGREGEGGRGSKMVQMLYK